MKAFDAEEFAEAVASALDVPLPEHCKPGVVANLERLAAMAELLSTFPLPDDDA
jgi:hypothetical protein